MQTTQEEFESIVTNAIAKVPQPYADKIDDIAFFIEDEPSLDQRQALGLRPCQSLFGLYEGVPLTERRGGYALTLPDRITIFKLTHEQYATSLDEINKQVINTVWHEVAHYFGLNHDKIYALENKNLNNQ